MKMNAFPPSCKDRTRTTIIPEFVERELNQALELLLASRSKCNRDSASGAARPTPDLGAKAIRLQDQELAHEDYAVSDIAKLRVGRPVAFKSPCIHPRSKRCPNRA
jgi:hypothetical protein